jgi:hypothetical protein
MIVIYDIVINWYFNILSVFSFISIVSLKWTFLEFSTFEKIKRIYPIWSTTNKLEKKNKKVSSDLVTITCGLCNDVTYISAQISTSILMKRTHAQEGQQGERTVQTCSWPQLRVHQENSLSPACNHPASKSEMVSTPYPIFENNFAATQAWTRDLPHARPAHCRYLNRND